ncbi:5875_t:CDS:2, partial [Funneliformis geosporum]
EAWDEQFARHRNIAFKKFTRRLPNISEQIKNKQFDIFSESTKFGPMEHNSLLESLADPGDGYTVPTENPTTQEMDATSDISTQEGNASVTPLVLSDDLQRIHDKLSTSSRYIVN